MNNKNRYDVSISYYSIDLQQNFFGNFFFPIYLDLKLISESILLKNMIAFTWKRSLLRRLRV